MTGGKACLPVQTLEANQPVAAHEGIYLAAFHHQ